MGLDRGLWRGGRRWAKEKAGMAPPCIIMAIKKAEK